MQTFTSPKTTLYAFCHNTNFDLPVLKCFSSLAALGWSLSKAVIDAPPTILTWCKGTAKIVLLDTLNWWRVSLKKLGELTGTPKLDMPAADASREEWDTYCKQDVEVIRKAVLGWLEMLVTEDLGGFAHTVSGQAMRTWRHKFMGHQVLIDDDERALRLSRTAYLGGRNELFRQGVIKGEVACVDFNSLYPSVMQGRAFPVSLVGFDALRPETTFAKYRASHATIGEVQLDTPEGVYPRVIEGRLCFPVGRFWAHLAGPELMYAVDHGHVVKFRSVAVYQQAELFTSYVDYFYTKRLEAKRTNNEILATYFKDLMNHLYGKFGQRGMVWEESCQVGDMESRAWVELDVTTGIVYHCRQLAGLKQVKSTAGEAQESFPAIAAYVTSYGRLALWRLMLVAGRENVLYCDTDSLFLTRAGLRNVSHLLSPTTLGAPKLEWTSREVELRGLKDYSVGDKVKVKGVRKSAVWVDASTVTQERWSGLTGQLRREDLDNAYTHSVTKHLSREYTKGTIDRRGRMHPFKLDES